MLQRFTVDMYNYEAESRAETGKVDDQTFDFAHLYDLIDILHIYSSNAALVVYQKYSFHEYFWPMI